MKLTPLLTLALLACGGGATLTQPTSRPGLARVQLAATAAALFQGHTLPSGALGVQVVDSAGYPVTDATLALTVSPGWSASGGVVHAPAAEGYGTLQLTASANGTTATSSVVTLTSMVRLDTLHLTGTTTTCRQIPGNPLPASNDSVGYIDSIKYTPHVDSLQYAGVDTLHSGFYMIANQALAGVMYLSGPWAVYGHWTAAYPGAGYADTTRAAHYSGVGAVLQLKRQVPDTLTLDLGANSIPTTVPRTGPTATYRVAGNYLCVNGGLGYFTADSTTLTPQ